MKRRIYTLLAALLSTALLLGGCGNGGSGTGSQEAAASPESASQADAPEEEVASESQTDGASGDREPVTILIAAAASLEYSFVEELIPLFQERYPHITVEGTYDSSGKLQTQIEEGLGTDLFLSAAVTQMNYLIESGHIDANSVVDLLENRIVLIAPADSDTTIGDFESIPEAGTVALGDPESVPVGQYAREALTTLGIYDAVAAKTSFGTNVTEVLNWVAEGSADVGIVYATDAATTDQVKILAEAPDGALASKVIYPVGILNESESREAADLFVEFLRSAEALAVFSEYGFTPNV